MAPDPRLWVFLYPGCAVERQATDVPFATDLALHRKQCDYCNRYLKRIDELIERKAQKTDKERKQRGPEGRLWK
jgi:hypothetical protein